MVIDFVPKHEEGACILVGCDNGRREKHAFLAVRKCIKRDFKTRIIVFEDNK